VYDIPRVPPLLPPVIALAAPPCQIGSVTWQHVDYARAMIDEPRASCAMRPRHPRGAGPGLWMLLDPNEEVGESRPPFSRRAQAGHGRPGP